MKILAGIPTRLRDTSGKIADVLAQVCDTVLVVSQGAKVYSNSSKVVVAEKDVNFGLVAARNAILRYAVDNNFDIVIQSDDDLKYSPEVVEALIREVLDNPTLGSIASSSRAYFNWNKEVGSNKNFVLSQCAPQLWASRTSILQEIGEWKLEYLEDREHGIRMWKAGYAIGLLHTSLNYTHNPFIARTSTNDEVGGQEKGMIRYERLSKAIAYMNEHHGDVVSIKQSPFGVKGRTFSTRYDWSKLLSYPVKRFEYSMGYEDAKGRRL